MAEQRTITLNMDAEQKTRIAEITGYDALHQAIGYLSGWNMSFGHLEITAFATDIIELAAVYRTTPTDPVGYVIGAVWHSDPEDPTGGHFGFHS